MVGRSETLSFWVLTAVYAYFPQSKCLITLLIPQDTKRYFGSMQFIQFIWSKNSNFSGMGLEVISTINRPSWNSWYTLPSITTVTKETFIVHKVFILKNSALYLLKAHDLPFFHAKFQSSGSNGLATTPIWTKKLLGKLEQILNRKIFEC